MKIYEGLSSIIYFIKYEKFFNKKKVLFKILSIVKNISSKL